MIPVELRTERLVLDQPRPEDVDRIAEYCADPIFERFMLTPWPYERQHALAFVTDHVPGGWREDREYTWALRRDGELLGVVGMRRVDEREGSIGYWIGAPFRRRGYMGEAVDAAIDWVFDAGFDAIAWEAVVGNEASRAVARSRGFRYTGRGPSRVGSRGDAPPPESWHAVLRRDEPRVPQPGWPEPQPAERPPTE